MYVRMPDLSSTFFLVGSKFGEAISQRVREELAQLVGQTEADALTKTRINFNDAGSGPWWTSQLSYDSDKEVSSRVDEFLQFARFCSNPAKFEASVFVGHSLFFKAVCKRIAPELSRNRPELAEKMKKYKLGHAAVLAVTVRYDNNNPPVIEDAGLLFGSTFQEH
jgi:hypothetical protein